MIETRYDEWQNNKDRSLEVIIKSLPVIPDQKFVTRLQNTIENFFLLSFLLTSIGTRSELIEDLDSFIKHSKKSLSLWNRVEKPLQLLVTLSTKSKALNEFDEPENYFQDRVRHNIYLAKISKDILNSISKKTDNNKKGRPSFLDVDYFIRELTNLFQTLDQPLKFKSNANKDQFGNTPYSNFLCNCLTVSGICPSNPFETCNHTCSGLVYRIRRYLKSLALS